MVTISLCMIVRNEEAVLGRCLESIRAAVDEIVIVDTGSEDETLAAAAKYTDRIWQIPWEDDFAAARNVSFAKALMDYCMWLDADDVLPEEECRKLLQWKAHADGSTDAVMMKYAAAFDDLGNPELVYYRERLLKRNRHFVWKGRVHEAIAVSGIAEYLDICVEHHSRKKIYSTRNLDIYRRMLAEGQSFSPRDRFYYGRELFYHGKYVEAVDNLLKFLNMKGAYVENLVDACRILAKCCYALGKPGEALEFLYGGLSYRVPSAELCCEIGKHFFDRKRWEQAAFWYKAALRTERKDKNGGFVRTECYGYLPCIQLSVCWYRLGDYRKALRYHQRAGGYKPQGREFLNNQRWFAKNLQGS